MITGRRLFGDPELNTVLRRVARGEVAEQLDRVRARRPSLRVMTQFMQRLLSRDPNMRPLDSNAAREEHEREKEDEKQAKNSQNVETRIPGGFTTFSVTGGSK